MMFPFKNHMVTSLQTNVEEIKLLFLLLQHSPEAAGLAETGPRGSRANSRPLVKALYILHWSSEQGSSVRLSSQPCLPKLLLPPTLFVQR